MRVIAPRSWRTALIFGLDQEVEAGAAEFEASLTGTATVAAALTTEITLAASLTGTATLTAPLTTAITLETSLTGTGTLTADLTTAISLATSLTGTATVTADLTGAGAAAQLEATLNGTANVTADLSTAITFEAVLSGMASLSADLTAEAPPAPVEVEVGRGGSGLRKRRRRYPIEVEAPELGERAEPAPSAVGESPTPDVAPPASPRRIPPKPHPVVAGAVARPQTQAIEGATESIVGISRVPWEDAEDDELLLAVTAMFS